MFSPEQQRSLLGLARQAITTALTTRQLLKLTEVEEAFQMPLGAFVTLTQGGNLRGCIGYPEPVYPLYETIIRGGISAATQDPRFMPVTLPELETVSIEISVLSPLAPILPEAVEVGKHGLVIEKGNARGLLLPQVPVEWGWDRLEYLGHLCRKAGLPADAWRQGATLSSFTAEVFSEHELLPVSETAVE